MIINIPFFDLSIDIRKAPPPPLQQKPFNKIFCIGANKTGTTSLAKLFYLSGLKIGNQQTAEGLSGEWYDTKNPNRLIKYVHTADVFQDTPFTDIELLPHLDKAFPGSKFILTVRDHPEQWYESLVQFHTKLFAKDKSAPPTEVDLAQSLHIYQGYLLDIQQEKYMRYGIPLYQKEGYIERYIATNGQKRQYFQNRSDDFIEINLSNTNDFNRLMSFLGISSRLKKFPWENKG